MMNFSAFSYFFSPLLPAPPYRYCTALATTPEHTLRVFRTHMSNVYKIFVLLNFHLVHFATLSDPCAGRTRAAFTSTPNTSFVLLAPCTHAVYYLLISLGKVLGKNSRTMTKAGHAHNYTLQVYNYKSVSNDNIIYILLLL